MRPALLTLHAAEWLDSAHVILTADPGIATDCMKATSTLMTPVGNRLTLPQNENTIALIGYFHIL